MTCTAKLLLWGKTYEAKGETPSEAIANLKVPNAKGKSVLAVSRGDVSREKVLTSFMTHRLFNAHGLTRQVALKHASILFDGI